MHSPSHSQDPMDPALLEWYLAGLANPDEVQVVTQWLAEVPGAGQELEAFARMRVLVRNTAPSNGDVVARVTQINARIDRAETAPPFPRPVSIRKRPSWFWYGAACVTTVVFLAVSTAIATRWGARHTAAQEYATTDGERLHVTLPDGTHAELAAGSRLRLAPGYETQKREVMLDGEAYFVVAHDVAHPFTVNARGTITRDVGTAFDVRAYTEDAAVRIAVAEGAVAVGHATLRAGDIARVNGQDVAIEHLRDVDTYLAWMRDTLIFRRTPLRDVARDIERAYGVTIVISDSTLLTTRINGTLANVPLDTVLDLVTRSIGARYERHLQTVTIMRATASTIDMPAGRAPPLTTAAARTGQE